MISDLVSIIMPVYNAEKFLHDSIESVINQSYSNWELIIIDDGSLDKSGAICDTYACRDNRIRVLHIKNGGVSNARNLGLSVSNGKWVEFLDSDDYINPEFLQVMVSNVGDADLIACSINVFPENSRKQYISGSYSDMDMIAAHFEDLYKNCFFNLVTNKLYLKEKISHKFPLNISLGEDLIFNLYYLLECKKISCLSECLFNYRLSNSGSLSSTFPEDLYFIEEKILEAYIAVFGIRQDLFKLISNQRIELLAYKTVLHIKNKKMTIKQIREMLEKCCTSSIFSKNKLDERWCGNIKCKVAWKAIRNKHCVLLKMFSLLIN